MKKMLKWALIVFVGLPMALFVGMIGIVAVLSAAGVGPFGDVSESANQAAAAQVVRSNEAETEKEPVRAGASKGPGVTASGGLSMENYLRLQTGMTIAQVEAILGGPGEEMSRIEMDGLPTTVSYKWQRWSGANIILMFQGGKMNMKAQAGL